MAFGIYIHLPYCLTKCPYCDFNSYGVGTNFPEDEYIESILKELEFYKDSISESEISTIFFGGGTPSLFSPKNIEKVIDIVFTFSKPSSNIEISLEINPKTADLNKLKDFRHAGINRASVGIQSFSERKLKFYKRLNTPQEGEKILEDVCNAGFDNFNLDLIYGSSLETLEELEKDLEMSIKFGPTHISAYCLTIEDGTEFGMLFSLGKLELPNEELLSEMFSLTSEFLEEHGYNQYEISNFSKQDYECRHNLLYWKSHDYLGFGAGAHSHLAKDCVSDWGIRWCNIKSPSQYMKVIKDCNRPVHFEEKLTREESFGDRLLMGLRLKEGVNISELSKNYGTEFVPEKLNYLINDDYITFEADLLRLTSKGRLYSNELILKVLSSFVWAN